MEEPSITEIDDKDFLYNYQKNHFKEDPENPFINANLKRKNIILSLAYSNQRLDNATSCHIFHDQLSSYFKNVDDRSVINNFAKATLNLVSNVKTASKDWKCGLSIDDAKWKNIWKKPYGECSNPTENGACGNFIPPDSAIPILLGSNLIRQENNCRENRTHDIGLHCQTKNSSITVDKLSTNLLKPSTSKNIPNKKDLYQYNQPGHLREQIKPSYPLKRNHDVMNNDHKKIQPVNSIKETCEDDENEQVKSGIYHRLPGGKGYYRNNKSLVAPLRSFLQDNDNEDEQEIKQTVFRNHFKTASHQLKISNQNKQSSSSGKSTQGDYSERHVSQIQPKKFLGGKRTVSSKFVPPVKNNSQEEEAFHKNSGIDEFEAELDERLKNIEPRMIELIKNEIMDTGSTIVWDDIAGLKFAKATIQEIVVWPMLRPDIFTGLRRPPKGILLFGPPGTGKTLIGKCIASQSNSTFFSISASSLTSKWIGDGEKMVRALFAVARCHQPAVVFIDEIDSLLSQRSDSEHESSRRIKTEFLVQLDGAGTGEEDRILVIGATNRPQELDEAARRRLVKRLYIPLPDKEARNQLVANLMKSERNTLTPEEIDEVSSLTDGYSGADMKNLCQEACLGPIRSLGPDDMFQITAEEVRPVNFDDFNSALKRVKSSVSDQDLETYLKWDQQYGSGGAGV